MATEAWERERGVRKRPVMRRIVPPDCEGLVRTRSEVGANGVEVRVGLGPLAGLRIELERLAQVRERHVAHAGAAREAGDVVLERGVVGMPVQALGGDLVRALRVLL